MRRSNPKAVTMLLSGFPEMDAAARAILKQTDQILLKPIEVTALIEANTKCFRLALLLLFAQLKL